MASGDPVARWAGLARQASARYGIPANVLLGLIRVESGGHEGETSSANAGGLTQFIPGTARQYGVDVRPGHARSQIFGAAKYLKALGFNRDPRAALNAYNGAQTINGRPNPYAGNVLGAARSYGSVRGGTAGTGGGAQVLVSAGGGGAAPGPDLGPGTNVTPAIAALLSAAQPQGPPVSLPAAPAHSAHAVMPQGYAPPSSSAPPVPAAPDVGALLDAVRTQGGDVPGGGSGAGGGVYTGSGATSGGAGGYVNPFGSSLKARGRIDEGVDPTIQGPIRAIGDAKVVNLSHNFYKGQPYLVYELTSGRHAGKKVYVSELITPHVKVGQRVRAGDVIATGHGAIETGWAGGPSGSYLPQANRAQGGSYTEGAVTPQGQSFVDFLTRLGARTAR